MGIMIWSVSEQVENRLYFLDQKSVNEALAVLKPVKLILAPKWFLMQRQLAIIGSKQPVHDTYHMILQHSSIRESLLVTSRRVLNRAQSSHRTLVDFPSHNCSCYRGTGSKRLPDDDTDQA